MASGLFTGFGLLSIFLQALNYIVDSYLMFAASALAGNTFLRSLAAGGFPLFARQMFVNLGIQWAGTLLGCLSLLLVPIPFAFWFYGPKLRQKSAYAPTDLMAPGADDEESAVREKQEETSASPVLGEKKGVKGVNGSGSNAANGGPSA